MSSRKKTVGDRSTDANISSARTSPRPRVTVSVNHVSISPMDGPSSTPHSRHMNKSPHYVGPPQRQTSAMSLASNDSANDEETSGEPYIFDICSRTKADGVVRLQKSLLEINKEKRRESQREKDAFCIRRLRPGMILLKKFINHHDQIKIIQICQKLGIGEGGFYRPGYRDGAKLHLQMMCLGKNWDPESRVYEDRRSVDGAMPPKLPAEFKNLVDSALHVSHDYLQKASGFNVSELPLMSPDICIVNFYSNNGKLGLHQDRDESTESRQKGLPVVSFSIGDSASFLFGDERDVEKANTVLLESGDVLIFGVPTTACYPILIGPLYQYQSASSLWCGTIHLTFTTAESFCGEMDQEPVTKYMKSDSRPTSVTSVFNHQL